MATEGQPLSVRGLFQGHGAFVYRSLSRLGVAEADLDDMVQDVFVVVHQRLADYEDRDRVRSWLYSICARVALAHRRKVQRRREEPESALPESEVQATQLVSVEEREALRLGQRLLSLLPPEQREVFVLYEVEDMTIPQIAEAMGCPIPTAYSRLYKARERVVAELERARDDGERT